MPKVTKKPYLTVGEIMQNEVLTAGMNDKLERVQSKMTMSGIHHVPVVEEGMVMGMISSNDVNLISRGGKVVPNLPNLLKAGDVMHCPLITVTPETSVIEAIDTMSQKYVHCLPVIDDDEKLVGIITHTDIAKLCASLLEGKEA